MNRIFALAICLAMVLSSVPTRANPNILIDALHGLPELLDYQINLDDLYPDYNFVSFGRDRVPIYNLLAEGVTRGNMEVDSFQVELTEEAEALYVVLDIDYTPGVVEQLPMIFMRTPDQTNSTGHFGFWHADHPTIGTYNVTIGWGSESCRYRIGTGPIIWDVYPPEDYSSVLTLNSFTWNFFRGWPMPHSEWDLSRIQDYLDEGGGYGLIYDAQEPIADKPVIHLCGFDSAVDLTLDLPGRLTYRKPQVVSEKPVKWSIPFPAADEEILYESAFDQSLNFVVKDAATGDLVNRSWACAHDAKLIRFEPGKGYHLQEFGTLQAGDAATSSFTATFTYDDIVAYLEHTLRSEAIATGMTKNETNSFFSRYGWTKRVLADVGMNGKEVCLCRLEGADFDGLIPLQSDPRPRETVRVLWVYSMLPTNSDFLAEVHPRVVSTREPAAAQSEGTLHEYGFYREHYGGDALDELEAWGWHCYDQSLYDPTNYSLWDACVLFHTPGPSPLSNILLNQVQTVEGYYTAGIIPLAGDEEVVMAGDDDTQSYWPSEPFPAGSYPPVIVAREEMSGGRIVGYGDIHFCADLSDNVQMTQNVLNWLADGTTGHGPDIDLPDAVAETTIVDDGTEVTQFSVINRGDETLTYHTVFPAAEWISIQGPTDTTLEAGGSAVYDLTWNGNGLQEGIYQADWIFTSNDLNEAQLEWPVRLREFRVHETPPTPEIPDRFVLHSVYPNPFNSQVSVRFSVKYEGMIEFSLYNIMGQKTDQLSRSNWTAGTHQLRLDFGEKPSGVYFLKATAGEYTQMTKLVLLK
jgi:hypothetical protein